MIPEIGNIGWTEISVIVVIAIIIFAAKKIPEILKKK